MDGDSQSWVLPDDRDMSLERQDWIPPEDRDMDSLPPLDPLWAKVLECWHCGGKPCDVDHEKERAIRIADMQFVRDIVSEKRDLEAQIAQLLAEMEERKLAEKMWQMEKYMLLRQIKEREEAEERWKNDRLLLEQEIQRLRGVNERLQGQIDVYRRNEGKLQMIQLRLDSVIEETVNLKEEIKRLNESNYQKILEIEKRKKAKEKLKEELGAMKDENSRLKAELANVKKELTDLKNDTTKDDLIEQLCKQVAQLEVDKNEALRKNAEHLITIRQLNLVISELQLQYTTSERLRLQLQQEVEELAAELLALKKRLSADKTFKKFVTIKRELNNVKDENEDLRDIVKSSVSPWPTYMKRDTTYNPAKIAQRAVEIVTGSKFTPRSQDTIAHDLGSQSSRVVHTPGQSPRPSTATGVRFADGTYPGLNRPKLSPGIQTEGRIPRSSSALGLRNSSEQRSPKSGRRAFVT